MQIQKAGVLSDAARASRALITTLVIDSHHEREADMERRWHWDAQRTKAAVGAFSSGDFNNSTSTSAEFMAHLVKQSVVARIAASTMRVGFNQPVNSPFSASAAWVPEMHAIPVYSQSLVNHSLPSRKVGAVSVFTQEALEQDNAEFALLEALSTACTEVMDAQFLNPDAVSTEAPRPITADAETIIASSDPAASFRELLQNFRSLATSFLFMHPETAAHLSLITVNGAHVFPDIGVLGGTICGLPVICSQSAPLDSTGSTITLLDASRVLLAMGGVSISRTESASIELQDEIDSDGMGEMVSLFQTNAVAAKSLLFANWKLLDPDACRILVGGELVMDFKQFEVYAKAIAPAIRDHVKGSIEVHDKALRHEFAALESRIAKLETEASTEKSLADCYEGPWQFGAEYSRGCLVTDRGSLWLSLGDNEKNTRPGSGPTWRLVSKKRQPPT